MKQLDANILKHFSVLVHGSFANGKAHHSVHVVEEAVVECTCILFDNIVVPSYGCISSEVHVFICHLLRHFKQYWINSVSCLKKCVPEME